MLVVFQDLLTSEDTENGFNVVYDNIFIACRHVAALGHKMGHIFIVFSQSISRLPSTSFSLV
jgi:hypothetical protein